mmetsp:Transcript_27349/g.43218  ORF Transcript_27349/g.43218 Transcript_27349/m.43218 type:complete len:82 (+) Transcript_27349:723-968(+)
MVCLSMSVHIIFNVDDAFVDDVFDVDAVDVVVIIDDVEVAVSAFANPTLKYPLPPPSSNILHGLSSSNDSANAAADVAAAG